MAWALSSSYAVLSRITQHTRGWGLNKITGTSWGLPAQHDLTAFILHLSQKEQGSICSSQGRCTKCFSWLPAALGGGVAAPSVHPRWPQEQFTFPHSSGTAGTGTNRGENCSWNHLQNYYIRCIFKRRCLWVHFLCAGWEISYITETQGAGKAQSINKAHWSSLELRWWVCTASWQSGSLAMSKVLVSPDNRDSKGYM